MRLAAATTCKKSILIVMATSPPLIEVPLDDDVEASPSKIDRDEVMRRVMANNGMRRGVNPCCEFVAIVVLFFLAISTLYLTLFTMAGVADVMSGRYNNASHVQAH